MVALFTSCLQEEGHFHRPRKTINLFNLMIFAIFWRADSESGFPIFLPKLSRYVTVSTIGVPSILMPCMLRYVISFPFVSFVLRLLSSVSHWALSRSDYIRSTLRRMRDAYPWESGYLRQRCLKAKTISIPGSFSAQFGGSESKATRRFYRADGAT